MTIMLSSSARRMSLGRYIALKEKMDRIKTIIDKLNSSGISHKGSSISEIEKIEKLFDIKFPSTYREFLKLFGEDSGDLFCGHVVETKHLLEIQDQGRIPYLKAIGTECENDIFFILEHQNYSFYYIKLDGNSNPDLYLLINGDVITNTKKCKIFELVEMKLNGK